jgi:hypothetical protein
MGRTIDAKHILSPNYAFDKSTAFDSCFRQDFFKKDLQERLLDD